MQKSKFRRFFVNVLCGLVWGESLRRKIRVSLNSSLHSYVRFIKSDMKKTHVRLRIKTGVRASNLIIVADKKYVYKFPYRRENYRDMINRERCVLDALAQHSDLYVPNMEIVNCDDIVVRRYEYIAGRSLREFPDNAITPHIPEYGRQVGAFLYNIGRADAPSLANFKTTDSHGHARGVDPTPGFMRGWYHGDIFDNFLIDENTMKIAAVIDWEDACFTDFSYVFYVNGPAPLRAVMLAARDEYVRLWNQDHPDDIRK